MKNRVQYKKEQKIEIYLSRCNQDSTRNLQIAHGTVFDEFNNTNSIRIISPSRGIQSKPVQYSRKDKYAHLHLKHTTVSIVSNEGTLNRNGSNLTLFIWNKILECESCQNYRLYQKNDLNKSCSELNFLQKSQLSHMSISPRSEEE